MNPNNTQVCAFHLNNEMAKSKLKIGWWRTELEHNNAIKYLGIILDRSLIYKEHYQNIKQKLVLGMEFLKSL